jgi:peptide/nickel transport system permease protein
VEDMFKYIVKRLLMIIPVLIGVTFVIFTIMSLTPGDAAMRILGEGARTEDLIRLREEMGLNDPFFVQYFRYMYNLIVNQDLGRSYVTRRLVFNEIIIRIPNTIKLAFSGTIVSLVIGVPLGVISAAKRNTIVDNIAMFFAMIGVSMPIFWQGILLLLLFSVTLRWLPSSGFDTWQQMLLPSLTLGTGSAAIIARMTRSSMLEVLKQNYVRTAESKGLSEFVVIMKHAFRNALIPVVTIVGLQFGALLGGAVLTETIFSINGVGRLMVDSIRSKDVLMVQGSVMMIAGAFILVNLGVDILYAFIDPRIRSQYK